jgi:hypothetical protein
MLKPTYIKILAATFGLALATTVQAQVVLGTFQSASDPNNAGWVDSQNSTPISTSPNCSFVNAGVTGYTTSLVAGGPGGFGHPQLVLSLSPAQITGFNANSWLTFTFSVPAGTYTGGYSHLYNLALNAPGYGYNNQSWANALEMGNTNGTPPGTMPNFGFSAGANPVQTMVVSLNYSSVTNAIIAGGEGYLQVTFQFNNGSGAPTNIILNNVFLSQSAFGAGIATTTTFIVDDFSTNGVGPQNPTNHDYYTSSNNYSGGQITNVWWNWFGSAFSNTTYAAGISPSYAPSQGSLALQANWTGTANQQFQVWNQGVTNNFYALNISGLTYTNFQCDVMYAPGSVTNAAGNFGLLQFGNRTPGYTSDYFGGGNNGITVAATNAGVWQHVSIALNPVTDTNLLNIQGLLIHTFDGSGTLNGPTTIYIDNIQFVGPLVTVQIPPPVVSIQPVTPGLRMFVGSSATYIREGVITTQGSGESESWVGAGTHYPVTYSFQLLSYPPTGIGVTELAILPEASFNPTANFQTTIYNNSFLDFQDSNGLYVVIAPFSGNGSVTAAVQWKVGLPSPGTGLTNLISITNSTAIGTWTLTMNNATQGTLTAPGGASKSFTIADPNVASDFANPAVAAFFEDPNSTAGYGLYEDVGTISITGVASGTQTENFSQEIHDFDGGTTSPGGYFQNNYSVDPANLVISRKGLDSYWVSWTQDLQNNYALTTATNLQVPLSQWISPIYYSGYNEYDETAPRGVGVNHAPNYWELLPEDCLPTVNGGFQSSPPAIDVPLAPNAFFIMTTNQANIFPVLP